jgi:hypothetical protein
LATIASVAPARVYGQSSLWEASPLLVANHHRLSGVLLDRLLPLYNGCMRNDTANIYAHRLWSVSSSNNTMLTRVNEKYRFLRHGSPH